MTDGIIVGGPSMLLGFVLRVGLNPARGLFWALLLFPWVT